MEMLLYWVQKEVSDKKVDEMEDEGIYFVTLFRMHICLAVENGYFLRLKGIF